MEILFRFCLFTSSSHCFPRKMRRIDDINVRDSAIENDKPVATRTSSR